MIVGIEGELVGPATIDAAKVVPLRNSGKCARAGQRMTSGQLWSGRYLLRYTCRSKQGRGGRGGREVREQRRRGLAPAMEGAKDCVENECDKVGGSE